MVAERERVGVGEQHRRARQVEHLVHHRVRHMGEVDDHAQPVQLQHHLAAERRQPAMPRRVGGAVDPVQRLVVAERHQPHAGRMPDPQRRQAVLQAGAALHGDEGGDPPLASGPRHIGGAARRQEGLGIARLHLQGHVHHLHHPPPGTG